MSGLYLVADDLTGALDSAASFCGRLGSIPVFLGAPHDDGSPHAAVDLATRDASAEFAALATARVAPRMATADIAYKKIDSLLRGHWAIELAGLIRTGAFSTCVFAPAFPSQGRTTSQGRQVVRATDGSCTAVSNDPAEALDRLGVRVLRATASGDPTLSASASSSGEVVIFDATTDDDLRRIVRWGSRQAKPVLWCGSAGLARALARQEPPQISAMQGPVLAIVGTNHAVAKAQIACAVAQGATRQVTVGADAARAAAAISEALERLGHCLTTFELPQGMSAADAASWIGRSLRELLPQIARPSSLLVAGGETLLSVCRAVGATHLEVYAELGPGLPRSRLCSGRWDGLEIVSKSGGFGHPQWLADLISTAR